MLAFAAVEARKRQRAAMRITENLPAPHPAQQQILDDPARFRVVACGRRFGKTESGKREMVKRVTRGERVWWLAPTHKVGSIAWRSLYPLFRDYPGAYINRTERRVVLPSGGWFEVRSTHNPDNLRGEGLDFAIMDEAAFIQDGVWEQVVRPMLATTEGGALFLSSPYGRNWFWQLYNRGLDPLATDWSSHRYTSADGGLISNHELNDIRHSTPERVYREEYLAEFLEDSGSVFRDVDAAVRSGQAVPIAKHTYIFGVDWGRSNDYTVIAVIDADTNTVVALDRFNQIGWHVQRGRLRALADKWKPAVIWAESNSIGSVNIEELQREGLPVRGFETTNRSKNTIINELALAIERQDIGLLDDAVLLNELKAYELERLPGGSFRYGAPAGGHDDTVIATALAWYGVINRAPVTVYDDSLRVNIGW